MVCSQRHIMTTDIAPSTCPAAAPQFDQSARACAAPMQTAWSAPAAARQRQGAWPGGGGVDQAGDCNLVVPRAMMSDACVPRLLSEYR